MNNINIKKITKILLPIAFILLVIFLIYYMASPITINVKTNEASLDQPVILDIQSTYKLKPYDSGDIEISIKHQYNNNEHFEFSAPSYDTGKYQVIFVPNYSGEYNISIKINTKLSTKMVYKTITVQ